MADEFTRTKAPVAVLEYEPSGFEQTLIRHKSKLILVGVLAIAGTVAFWGWRLYGEATHTAAAVDFTRAETVSELKAVAEKHAGKPAAGSALVLAAEKLSAERPGEAIGLLKDFLAKYEKHPARDLAAFRIAEYYSASGDAASAEKEYDAVSKAGSPFSAFALLRLGDIKWGAGDIEKARETYQIVLGNGAMSGSPARGVAQARIDRALKSKAPVLVEYKEEPPPATPGLPGAPGASEFKVPGLGEFGTDGRSPSDSLLPPPSFDPPPVPPAPPLPTVPPVPSPSPAPDGAAPPAGTPAPPVEAPAPSTETPAPAPADSPAETPIPAPAVKKDPAKPIGKKK